MDKIKIKFSEPEIEFIKLDRNENVLTESGWSKYYRLRPEDDFSLDIE